MCDTEVDKSQPPEFLTRPKPLNVTEGSSAATFTCRVQGHPPPTVSWECNGCPLSSSEHYKISRDGDRHSLEVVRPRSEDSGQYTCHAHNRAGRASHSCSLTVTQAPGSSSGAAGAVDFRAVLKPRQGAGQLRPQRSVDWDRSDKENHVTDFRHVLRNSRQNSLPQSTNTTTTTTTTATSRFAHRTVPNGTSTSSTASSVSSSASGRVGGVRKNLELFEKQTTTSSERSAVTSRRSASPDERPLPDRTGLTLHESPSPDIRSSPGRDVVKDSAAQDRRKGDPVPESVLTSSTVHSCQSAPGTSRERARERNVRDLKTSDVHGTFSKSLDRAHWRNAELTVQPAKTDFRSVLSKPQASPEHSKVSIHSKPPDRSKVSTDFKPSWARPDPSRDQRKNGHSRDLQQPTSGKVDFRSVLKTRQTEDSGRSTTVSRDNNKTNVQPSQSATDFRSVLSKLKQGGDEWKSAPSKPAQSKMAPDRPPVNKSLSSKDLNNLRSKFETPAQNSDSVQSKPARPLTTTTTTTTATTTVNTTFITTTTTTTAATTKDIMASGQSDPNITDSTATSSWKDRSQDRLALKEVDNTTDDINSWRERRRDRLAAKAADNKSEDISDSPTVSSWRERRRERAAQKAEDSQAEDVSGTSTISSWKQRRQDRLAQKEANKTPEDVSSWKEQRRDRLAVKNVVDNTAEDKAPDIISSLNDKSRFVDDLKCSDSSQLSDSAISSAFSKLSELSDLSDSSSAVSEVEAPEPRSRRRLDRLKERLGGSGGSGDGEGMGEEAPSIGERLEDCKVRYGGQVVLQCRVSGVPPPTISWSHNTKTIKPSRFFQVSYQENLAQLLVAEAFSEDEGEYTCTATNSAGTQSCSCYLTVEASSSRSSHSDSHIFEGAVSTPPRVDSLTPASQTVKRGQPATFQLTFSGSPAPAVAWFRGKTPLDADDGVTIVKDSGTSTLTITSTAANNSGRYMAILTNDLGTDQLSATLSVEDVPESPVGMPHVYDISRRSVSISWCGPAYDGGSVITHYVVEVKDAQSNQWSTLTDDCKSTSYHALTLKPDTSYQFRVRAANRLGLSEPSLPTPSVVMTDPLQTSEDYESDDELPFEPREVSLTPGRKFEDHYEYLNEVGKGKFGSVYKCRDKQTGKIWAAKVLKVREKEKAGVRGEVEVMNRLAHPKLLMLWDAFEAARTMVLVMEFVGAGELFERVIREDFVLTERDCVHFVRQICNGVGYMHSKSILHLDLKPENILCVAENSNQIKIIDFGLARFYKPGDSLQVLFGTPEFIAPEVINYDAISFATDMWSIGVICYILLSGLSPFQGDTDAETLANVTSGEYDFDDESFDDISDKAKNFIGQLLVKRKEKRPTITDCEKHTWLSEEDQRIRCKRLNTDRLRTFMARRKWQKTGNAIRALGRMASLQKLLAGGSTSHSSSGSLSSIPDAPAAAPSASGGVSTPVFSPPIHHPASSHPLSSAAVKEVEEKKEEASAADTTTTATTTATSRKGAEREKGDSKLAAETSRDWAKSPAAATITVDRQSSPSSWRRRKQEGGTADIELSTQPSGRSELTNQDTCKEAADITDSARKAPEDKPAHATPSSRAANRNTAMTTKSDTDRLSSRAPAPHEDDGALCPPRFLKEMVDCRAFQGDVVRFDVTVTGRPPPRISWQLEEEEVGEDERHSVEQGEGGHWSLIVRNVDEDDDGEYQCLAVNSQGEACCTADLSVYSMGAV